MADTAQAAQDLYDEIDKGDLGPVGEKKRTIRDGLTMLEARSVRSRALEAMADASRESSRWSRVAKFIEEGTR